MSPCGMRPSDSRPPTIEVKSVSYSGRGQGDEDSTMVGRKADIHTTASTHDCEHYQQHLAEIAHAIGFAHVSTIHAAEAAHLSALLMTVGY